MEVVAAKARRYVREPGSGHALEQKSRRGV
jgi:hypothetical protein